jgi:hypothetical protein
MGSPALYLCLSAGYLSLSAMGVVSIHMYFSVVTKAFCEKFVCVFSKSAVWFSLFLRMEINILIKSTKPQPTSNTCYKNTNQIQKISWHCPFKFCRGPICCPSFEGAIKCFKLLWHLNSYIISEQFSIRCCNHSSLQILSILLRWVKMHVSLKYSSFLRPHLAIKTCSLSCKNCPYKLGCGMRRHLGCSNTCWHINKLQEHFLSQFFAIAFSSLSFFKKKADMNWYTTSNKGKLKLSKISYSSEMLGSG